MTHSLIWTDEVNNSGTPGPPPIEVLRMGWSWGAFAFSWVWALANRAYWAAVLAIVAANALSVSIATPGHRGHGIATGVTIVSVWLGVRGHRLAWRHRRFRDIKQYQDTMRAWNRWGLGLSLVGIVGTLVYLVGGAWWARVH